jgi:histidinol-phosphatase (PHP family)
VLDYHVHLWPHEDRADSEELRVERLARYCERATAAGVGEIAVTEHLFRFVEARELIGPFWAGDPDPALAAQVGAYWDHHATASLDDYVSSVIAAKRAGLPLVLGLEVDYYPGRMDDVSGLLAGYPFDVLLGSVHWLGNWMFDVVEDEAPMLEWERRDVAEVWRAYTEAIEELAATGACDVLAHPDLIKLLGHRPPEALRDECEEQIAEAAARAGMAAELSSAGWRKPVGEQYPAVSLLAKFQERGVALTTASDTHGAGRVAERSADLRALAVAAGYGELRAYRERAGRPVPIMQGAGVGT